MDLTNFDLKALRKPLEDALSAYEVELGMRFQDFQDFALTPEKPYSARTVIPVVHKKTKVGDLYALVFQPGDGTGDSKTHRLEDLTIPLEYQHPEKPERVIPRAKTGVICEGFLPLFSLTPQGYSAMFAASLEELGLINKTISPLWKLGLALPDYSAALREETLAKPQIHFTVGTNLGKRFGDPHSIYYPKNSEEALQVAGFLAISQLDNPLMEQAKKWKIPPQLE